MLLFSYTWQFSEAYTYMIDDKPRVQQKREIHYSLLALMCKAIKKV